MIKEIYVLFDKKADQYGVPIFVPGLPVLLRDLRDELRKGQSGGMIAVHPEDFCLYRVGRFDDSSGDLDVISRVKVCEVVSLVDVPA